MDVIRINERDQVVVAPTGLRKGQSVEVAGRQIRVLDDIPACHKMAVENIAAGTRVVKYGCPFGVATKDIGQGQWVHTHNVRTELKGIGSYRYEPSLEGAKTGRRRRLISRAICAETARRGSGTLSLSSPRSKCANVRHRRSRPGPTRFSPIGKFRRLHRTAPRLWVLPDGRRSFEHAEDAGRSGAQSKCRRNPFPEPWL